MIGQQKKTWYYSWEAEKKVLFLMAGPLRAGGGGKGRGRSGKKKFFLTFF